MSHTLQLILYLLSFSDLSHFVRCSNSMISRIETFSLSFAQNKFGVKKRPPPPANCIPVGGSCKSPGNVCCDFCAFCKCRLFRTVCYCRMGNPRCWTSGCSPSKLRAIRPILKKQNKLHAKSKPLEVDTERWITSSPRFVTLPPKFTAWKHFITEDCTTMNFPKTLQGVLLILKHCNDDLSYVFILLWASSMH